MNLVDSLFPQPHQISAHRVPIEPEEARGPRSVEQLKEVWLEDPSWELEATAGFEGYRDHLREFAAAARAAWAHPQSMGAERTDPQVLVSIAQLQTEQLAVLQHIRNSLDQPTESRSSCSVKTSTRGQDLECKSYADGLLPRAVDEAISEFARGQRMLAELQANGWQSTLANGERL